MKQAEDTAGSPCEGKDVDPIVSTAYNLSSFHELLSALYRYFWRTPELGALSSKAQRRVKSGRKELNNSAS